jgi:hypothetical protein
LPESNQKRLQGKERRRRRWESGIGREGEEEGERETKEEREGEREGEGGGERVRGRKGER